MIGPHILVSIDVPLDIQNLPGRYVQNLLDSRLSSDSRCSFRISGIIDASHAAIESHFTYFQIPRKSLEWNSSIRIWRSVFRTRFCRSSPNREDIERRFSGNVSVYDYYSVTENEHTSKCFRTPNAHTRNGHTQTEHKPQQRTNVPTSVEPSNQPQPIPPTPYTLPTLFIIYL